MSIVEPSKIINQSWNEHFNRTLDSLKYDEKDSVYSNTSDIITTITKMCDKIEINKNTEDIEALCNAIKDKKIKKKVMSKIKSKKSGKDKYKEDKYKKLEKDIYANKLFGLPCIQLFKEKNINILIDKFLIVD